MLNCAPGQHCSVLFLMYLFSDVCWSHTFANAYVFKPLDMTPCLWHLFCGSFRTNCFVNCVSILTCANCMFVYDPFSTVICFKKRNR